MKKLAGGSQAGTSDSPHYQGSWEWVDNNMFDNLIFDLDLIISILNTFVDHYLNFLEAHNFITHFLILIIDLRTG